MGALMSNSDVSTVHLAVFDTLADWQYGDAIAHILGHQHRHRTPEPFDVKTVGATRDPIVTSGGVRVVPDLTLDELESADSVLLILCGGDGWVPLYDLRVPPEPGVEVPDLLATFADKAKAFVDAGVPVAAIGGATSGLARVGLLDDRAHTSDVAEFLERSGYGGVDHFREGELAVTDGDVVTAVGFAPVDFAREIFLRLDLFEPHVLDAWYRLYGKHDASALYDLMAMAAKAA